MSWNYHFWARFWPNFNFVDFRAYFGPFSLVKRAKNKIAFLQQKKCSNKKSEENKPTLKFNFLWKSKCASLYFQFWVLGANLDEPYWTPNRQHFCGDSVARRAFGPAFIPFWHLRIYCATFRFQVMPVLVRGTRPMRQKVFAHPSVGVTSASNSRSALSTEALPFPG